MHRLSGLPFLLSQSQLLYHGGNKEQGDGQRYCQVDNYHGSKVLQVQPDLFIQEEDDDERTDCSQCSGQDGEEGSPVMPVADMVGHDDRIVDHQALKIW